MENPEKCLKDTLEYTVYVKNNRLDFINTSILLKIIPSLKKALIMTISAFILTNTYDCLNFY